MIRQVEGDFGDQLGCVACARGHGEEAVAAKSCKRAPQFRLKDHHDGHREEGRESAQQEPQHAEVKNAADQGQREQHDKESS